MAVDPCSWIEVVDQAWPFPGLPELNKRWFSEFALGRSRELIISGLVISLYERAIVGRKGFVRLRAIQIDRGSHCNEPKKHKQSRGDEVPPTSCGR